MALMTLWTILSGLWLGVRARGEPTCFADAVLEADRKSLIGPDGPYPLGVWACDWPAAYVTSAVVEILLREVLGFNTVQTGPGPSTVDAFYALTGCTDPTNIEDRGCSTEPVVTRNHISVEGWTEAYTTTWAQIENDYPQNAPRNLGNMGYFGKTSMYLPTKIKRSAYEAEGLILQFYQGFNVSWTQAEKYFDPLSSIPKEKLKRCIETRLMVSQAMEEYANVTADFDGVVIRFEDGKRIVNGRCWSEYFWYPPACRDDPLKCVIFFTGGSGWNLEETMQKAAAWNMPLAPAVAANWGNYTKLPEEIDSTFYWWVPDPTFLLLNPVEITFPAFDRFAHTRGDKRTAPTALSVDKYVSQDLETRAPEAAQLIRALILDLEVVNDMLRDQLQTGGSSWEVACRWLQQNEALWKPWLPDPTQCMAGFGLFDPKSQSFVTDRQDPDRSLICSPCPSGRFSSKVRDLKGATYICEPCAAGTVQPSGASLECVPCKAGEYQDVSGGIACQRCRLDEYQDQTGATSCKVCPAGTGSAGLGSAFLADCGCREGSINLANMSNATACTACSEGLHCPLGSTLESLKSGVALWGPAFTPKIKEGYFSTEAAPTEVFQCQASEHCPGGLPGSCAGGRQGVPCSECPAGRSWDGAANVCVACANGLAVMPILAAFLFLLCLTLAYYLLPTSIKLKASPKDALSMSLGVLATLVQCLAIIGLTSVSWPHAFQQVSSSSGVVLLDLDVISAACMVSGPESGRYILSIMLFPLGVSWLLLCFVSSSRMCRAWSRVRTFNTGGHFLQVAFGTMSALALQPLMCSEHPNGQRSLLKHPGVFCGTEQHVVMTLFGPAFLGSLTLGFFGTCLWAAWHMPKWSVSAPGKIPAFAFLISRFKMDRWWYGVPALLRGPLLSVCPVLATDFPPVQAALLTLVLTASVLMHMLFLPWKLPLVNLVDGLIQSVLLLLVAITSSHQAEMESFHQHVALVGLFVVAMAFSSLVILAFCARVYLLIHARPLEGQDFAVLNLGGRRSGAVVTQMSKEVAHGLLGMEDESLQKAFNGLHCSDLARLVEAMDLMAGEVTAGGVELSDRARVISRRSMPEMDLAVATPVAPVALVEDPSHVAEEPYSRSASPGLLQAEMPQRDGNGDGCEVKAQVLGAGATSDELASLSPSDLIRIEGTGEGPQVVSMAL